MIKILLCFLVCSSLQAQSIFHKKIENLQNAEGLALLPDGGYVLAGLQSNCIQLLRFDPSGNTIWTRQVCAADAALDISIGRIQLIPDLQHPGGFMLLFRKGGFFSTPDNLLNLMKFDAGGNLIWETQLRPEKRYGPFTPGGQLSMTPSGAIWACHGMGFTDPYPDFNQALVYKVSNAGQILIRRFYKTETPATVNGILAANDQDIYVYGGLGDATIDGFILKINELGEVVWANRYKGLHFLRDGGRFANGDLLLMAEHQDAYALLRLQPDGNLVWGVKFNEPLSLFHCAAALDEAVWMTGRKPNGPAFFAKMQAPSGQFDWAKTYEDCTRFQTYSLAAAQDGGLVWSQSGATDARLVKSDQSGNISAICPSWALDMPTTSTLSSIISPIQFEKTDRPVPDIEHVFSLLESNLVVQDCCPTEYPQAHFVLPDSACVGAAFSLRATGNACAEAWDWHAPDGNPVSAQTIDFQDIVFENSGIYPIMLTEKIGNCTDTFVDTIRVVTSPQINLFSSPDTVVCPDGPFELSPNLSRVDSWVWEDGNQQTSRLFELLAPAYIRLKAFVGLCVIEDSIAIHFGNCGPSRVYVPNAFSPNDDGDSDYWEVFMQKGVALLECRVFDRWGNLCFESKEGVVPRWDGTLNGKIMPSGVYVWQLKISNPEGQTEWRKGDLFLLR